jgi:hypothetical protein
MKSLASLLDERKPARRSAPHAKAAAANEIVAFLGNNSKASYGLWLKRIGTASYGDVMAILKRAQGLPAKYSRGGYVTNQLKNAGRKLVDSP